MLMCFVAVLTMFNSNLFKYRCCSL